MPYDAHVLHRSAHKALLIECLRSSRPLLPARPSQGPCDTTRYCRGDKMGRVYRMMFYSLGIAAHLNHDPIFPATEMRRMVSSSSVTRQNTAVSTGQMESSSTIGNLDIVSNIIFTSQTCADKESGTCSTTFYIMRSSPLRQVECCAGICVTCENLVYRTAR